MKYKTFDAVTQVTLDRIQQLEERLKELDKRISLMETKKITNWETI